MSAPAANASSPAPRNTTQRRSSSADTASSARVSAAHIAAVSAFNFPGLESVTVATTPSRATTTSAVMAWKVAIVMALSGAAACRHDHDRSDAGRHAYQQVAPRNPVRDERDHAGRQPFDEVRLRQHP